MTSVSGLVLFVVIVAVQAQWGWKGRLDAASVDLNEDVNEAVRLHEESDFVASLPFYLRALRRNPNLGTVYYNVGTGLATILRHAEAAHFFKTASKLDPMDVEAQCRVGEQLQRSHQYSAAVDAYRGAAEAAAQSKGADFLATAHDGLAVALASLKEYEPALKEFRRVSNLSPYNARAYHNIGAMLRSLKRPSEAVKFLENVISLLPNEPNVQAQLSEALHEAHQGNVSVDANYYYNQAEDILVKNQTASVPRGTATVPMALEAFQRALRLNPLHLDSYHRMALTQFNMGEVKQAREWWEKSLIIAKGNSLHPPLLTDSELKRMYYHRGLMNETLQHKLKHDYEQVQYLIKKNKARGQEYFHLEDLAAKYKTIHDALPQVSSNTGSVSLTDEEIGLVGASYNKAWNRPTFDSEVKSAINPNLNFPDLEEAYLSSASGSSCTGDKCVGKSNVMTVDKFLTPEALAQLRVVCEEGTYWFNVKPWGYLGAYLNDGFHVDVVLKIAQELPLRFPRIFGSYKLSQLWAYKYDSSMEGVSIHADDAAVNVNLWITDNDANEEPDSGGMIVFKEKAPEDWEETQYHDGQLVKNLVQNSKLGNVTVPYRANRAIFFDGALFHQSDKFNFKPGYAHRRINLTFLYGERGEKFRPQKS